MTAEVLYSDVLASSPEDEAALRGIAVVRGIDRRHEAADLAWERVLPEADDDDTFLLHGWSRLDRFLSLPGRWERSTPQAADLSLIQARSSCTRALRIGGARPAVQQCLAVADMYLQPGLHDGSPLERLSSVHAWRKRDPGFTSDWILSHAYAGFPEEAWELLSTQAVSAVLLGDAPGRTMATLGELALHRARLQILAGDISAARQSIAPLLEHAPDDRVVDFDRQLVALLEERRREAWIERHNEAAVLVSEGSYEQARRLLDELSAEPLPDDIAESVHRLITQIEAARPSPTP